MSGLPQANRRVVELESDGRAVKIIGALLEAREGLSEEQLVHNCKVLGVNEEVQRERSLRALAILEVNGVVTSALIQARTTPPVWRREYALVEGFTIQVVFAED